MKKLFILSSFICFSLFIAQQSKLVIANYTPFDYKGVINATVNNGCYPMVSNTYYPNPPYPPLKVGAGVTANVGMYSSGTEVQYWDVQTSATNPVIIRYYTHASMNSVGTISLNTDWQHSKFEMYYAGTSNPVPFTTVNISSGNGTCFTWPSYYTNPNNSLEAEWFQIGGITYLQIYY